MNWHDELMQALKESKAGRSTSLQELCQTARREIMSDQYLSRLSLRNSGGYTDIKMKQANDD